MTSTQANPGYASGWAVNAVPNRWHSGSLPGTSTIAVQTSSGLCWAGFTNSRSKDIAGALDTPEVRARAEQAGFEITPSTPQALRERIEADVALYEPLVREGRVTGIIHGAGHGRTRKAGAAFS